MLQEKSIPTVFGLRDVFSSLNKKPYFFFIIQQILSTMLGVGNTMVNKWGLNSALQFTQKPFTNATMEFTEEQMENVNNTGLGQSNPN